MRWTTLLALSLCLPWDGYFTNILPEGVNGMVVVLHDTCGDHYTCNSSGPAIFLESACELTLEVDTQFASFLQPFPTP
jgi:hypothetical protein